MLAPAASAFPRSSSTSVRLWTSWPRLNSPLCAPPDGNLCVLGEVAARVETEEQPAFELKQGDGAVGAGSLVCPLATDDAGRLEAKPVAVERERPLKIFDGQRDHIQTRFHQLSSELPRHLRRWARVRLAALLLAWASLRECP